MKSPPPSSPAVSKSMRANKSKGTGPELAMRGILLKAGVHSHSYRRNDRKVPGTPDFSFPGIKLAVFVNGCFWHRCPKCALAEPKTHPDFWRKKFERNAQRDAENIASLKSMGWRALVVWECEIRGDPESVVTRVKGAVATKCRRCGRTFMPSRITEPVYCSRNCCGRAAVDRQKNNVREHVCAECGMKFKATDYFFMVDANERKYCGDKCHSRVLQRRVYWKRRNGLLPPTSRKYQRQMARRKKTVPGRCRDCSSPLSDGDVYRCSNCKEKRVERRMFS